MFAIPSPASAPPGSLVQQVFGRFMARPASADAELGEASAMSAATACAEDDVPDLAQRVREVGEW